MVSVLALHPPAPGLSLRVPGETNSLIVAENHRQHSTAMIDIMWTVQKLNKVDQTHLVLRDSATKKTAQHSGSVPNFSSSRHEFESECRQYEPKSLSFKT